MSAPTDDAKRQHLARRRALHPAPDQVTDPLFHDEAFFDRRDLVQVKYEMLRRVRVDRRSVSGAAAAFGVSRPTYYEAQAAFARAGLPGLLPAKKGPRRAHKLSDRVMTFVDQQREAEPGLTAAQLAARVRGKFGVTVHPRSLTRALERRAKKNTS
jgi:transposase